MLKSCCNDGRFWGKGTENIWTEITTSSIVGRQDVFTVEAFDFHNFLLQRLKAEAQQQSFLLCFA